MKTFKSAPTAGDCPDFAESAEQNGTVPFSADVLLRALSLLVVALTATASPAAEWGSLKGRFVVDGTPAPLPPLVVDKDQFCIDSKPTNNSVVIGKDNGLVNAVVYLRLPRRAKVEIHPDYEAKLAEPVLLDNKGCQFVPHITLVRVGQTLDVKSSDPVGHNTNITIFSFNQTIPEGGLTIKVNNDAPLPSPVQCNIHTWMKGHILAQEHPYMAVSGEDGAFEIMNLPAGKHEFQFWRESGYLKDLKLKEGKTNRQGRIELTIAPGETLDLGDIKVPAKILK